MTCTCVECRRNSWRSRHNHLSLKSIKRNAARASPQSDFRNPCINDFSMPGNFLNLQRRIGPQDH